MKEERTDRKNKQGLDNSKTEFENDIIGNKERLKKTFFSSNRTNVERLSVSSRLERVVHHWRGFPSVEAK